MEENDGLSYLGALFRMVGSKLSLRFSIRLYVSVRCEFNLVS